ncbi:photosynthetic reaction center cytochrome c subunit [Oscillochloris sp. ZM17-4]|uniref:photosynthetic reaction center cytochrome c subunit family protein n=1 Tax=Oscillochloris sp. ZM17-4 TaxID=2866714 RepID=UPI001C72F6FB|nr:photosynthetic reaction center cytochrome c subunit family protein [Oscillochloris sp. ZM17-4]MBX0327155.1 photosynthetic reaction center cytochrome c subunit [Oscillochloris sp. ZM17-4]
MQSSSRPSDRQTAIFVSVAVGIIVAVVTTATFYWVYDLALGQERAAATVVSQAPWSSSDGIKVITSSAPNVPTDGRQPWLGTDAWVQGVQAGQTWVQNNPNPVNVQVLTGMDSAQIWAYMQQYVAGALGVSCQYCHDINNFSLDTYAQKTTARNMMYLATDLNANFILQLPNWRGNYVQCATCHNSKPNNLEGFAPQFVKSVPPIHVTVDPLDSNGEAITDPALKPAAIQGQVKLQDAILYYIYNYQVWKPYDAADPESGRGSLALTYKGGRSQDQVTINQNVMNNNSWSLGVGCNYCHNSRNFTAYETQPANNVTNQLYAYNKLKAQQMLLMTSWIQANWTTYGAIAKPAIPTALEGGASSFSYQQLNGQYYNVPGCYTCHQGYNNADGISVPRAAMNQSSFVDKGDAGQVIFPQALRGGQ